MQNLVTLSSTLLTYNVESHMGLGRYSSLWLDQKNTTVFALSDVYSAGGECGRYSGMYCCR